MSAMGLAVLVIAAVFMWLLLRRHTSSKKTSAQSRLTSDRDPSVPALSLRIEMARPDPEEWARAREARHQARDAAIQHRKAAFVRPATIDQGTAGIVAAIGQFAHALSVLPPDVSNLRNGVTSAGEPRKVELAIRRHMNDAYKLRTDPTKLVEALTYCVLHILLVLKHEDPSWKVATSIKRLGRNLDHELFRSACIGFLIVVAGALRTSRPDLATVCDEDVDQLFRDWHSDEEAAAGYGDGLRRLKQASSASDKHFVIIGLVGYLNRRRRFDAQLRAQLIDLCEQDVALYKTFLTDFTRAGDEKITSFAKAVRSEHYMCPSLPSFDALWDLYEEEGNVTQLQRLQKISREIKYGEYEVDASSIESRSTETTPAKPPGGGALSPPSPRAPAMVPADSVPTEMVEVRRSGQKGKLAFLDEAGTPCSTEEAAQDHLRRQGFTILRGEVQFWQAMFALAFWEDIFEGTGTPNAMNDIPTDLFSGAGFYASRRARIDQKAAQIARTDVRQYILGQLQQHGDTWTRILYDGPRGQFGYRRVLASPEVEEFLGTIAADVFVRIVHRIASNPTENRSGLPDYMMWKGRDVVFVEVKGVREQVRESQVAWMTWMRNQGIPVKIVRVKGVAA